MIAAPQEGGGGELSASPPPMGPRGRLVHGFSAPPRSSTGDTALQIGKQVAGAGVPVPAVERARMREDLAELVPYAETLIDGVHRALSVERVPLEGVADVPRRVGEREPQRSPAADRAARRPACCPTRRSRSICAQGARRADRRAPRLRSRKVLGQYDVFLPPDDDGLLYFVGPNVVEVERTLRAPPAATSGCGSRSTRSRTGSSSARRPGSAPHLGGTDRRLPRTVAVDSRELMNQLKRAVDEAGGRGLAGHEWHLPDHDATSSVSCSRRMQALMTLLEGHASFVMNEVGRRARRRRRPDAPDAARSVGKLARRRRAAFQQAIGFERRSASTTPGERFVREVGAAGGHGRRSTACGRGRSQPPEPREIADPGRWVARVVK